MGRKEQIKKLGGKMKCLKYRTLGVSLLLVALVAAACGDSKSNSPATTASSGSSTSSGTVAANTTTTLTPKDGGSVTMGVFSETAGLDPVVTYGGGTTGTTEVGAIYDTIMRYDTDNEDVRTRRLAESLKSNTDNSEWTLKLRPNVKFTDGTDYDADAVVFGMKRHSQYGSRARGLVSRRSRTYTVVDKLTVKFTLTRRGPTSPTCSRSHAGHDPVADRDQGRVQDRTARRSEGRARLRVQYEARGRGAVHGRLVQARRNRSTSSATRRTGAASRHLDSLKFVTFGSAADQLDALKTEHPADGVLARARTGQEGGGRSTLGTYLNLVWAGSGLILNNGKVACKGGLPAAVCAGKPDGIVELDTPTKDLRVRQAISDAIDPKVIDDRANNGTGYPGGTFFQQGSKWKSSSPVNTFNLDQAKKLVQEVKAEGKWDGSVRLVCSPAQTSTATAVEAMLKAAGFAVNVNIAADTAAQINTITNAKQFDVGCWGFSMADEAPEVIFSLAFNAAAAGNSMNHQITDIDAQSKVMREAKNDAEKQAALDKIQDIWRAQVPSVIYAATPERIVWRKSVHGVTPNVASTVLWHNVWVE